MGPVALVGLLFVAALGGAAATDARFSVVDGAVRDDVTRLEWKAPDNDTHTWANALCIAPWRLSTIEDWSATDKGADAWFVDFGNGAVGTTSKSAPMNVTCVKDF